APAPAVLGGVLAQTIPFAFDQLGVLQLLALWPTLALLASIVAWAQEGRRRHAIAIGLSLAASALTCGYLFALTLLAVLPVALGAGLARARSDHVASARRWANLAWAVGLPLVLAGPVVVGQRRRLEGHRWLRSTIDAGSATASDWVGSGRAAPTLGLVALGLAGAWLGRRQPAARFVAAVGLLGAVASFGTNLAFGPVRPWAWLVDEVSAFAQLRSPYRSAFLAQLALAALGALALDALWRWRPTSKDARAWTGPAVAVLATALAVALAHPGPGSMAVAARAPGIWHDRLRDLAAARPATDPQAAVVFLPFAPSPATEDFAATTERMLQNLDTGVPMVNGYSGFFPSDHATLRAQLRGFPDRRSLVALG
ncbi:MAG: hypothetical protein KDA94_16125, partial [Acidimicrobiales bacterium]|nr:hypothetical protein [Acidimicrobiales bacterium]